MGKKVMPYGRNDQLRTILRTLYMKGETEGLRYILGKSPSGMESAVSDAQAAILRWETKR